MVPPGVPLGTNSVNNRKKLSQAGTVLPMSSANYLKEPWSNSLPPKNLETTIFAFLFYTTASLASSKHNEIETFKEEQRK